MKNKVYEISGIGEVLFVKSKKARHARITIKPEGVVKVTVPFFMPMRVAKQFVEEKKSWINKNLTKQKERNGNNTIFDEKVDFSTNLHRLKIERTDSNKIKSVIDNDAIIISIPAETDIYSDEIQSFIRKNIEESWRIEAKQYLPNRTKELASIHGFDFEKVTIRNTKSRWGSCSFHNNISYSLHLMRLPVELQDYVVLHELVHTKQKNHQQGFWNLLDSVTDGKAKILDKQLKKFSTRIY